MKKYSVFILCLCLNACAGRQYTVELLYQSSACAQYGEGLYILQQQKELNKLIGSQLLMRLDNVKPFALVMDNSRHTILFSLGERPTPGYAINVTDKTVNVKGGSLNISLGVQPPMKDSSLPQVVTTPCAVFLVEKGSYNKINVNHFSVQVK